MASSTFGRQLTAAGRRDDDMALTIDAKDILIKNILSVYFFGIPQRIPAESHQIIRRLPAASIKERIIGCTRLLFLQG
ncbi:hypothetical protein An03g00950 [Aspergillus niger]|uniref:Uncharacterized protein n=2 Tax=Aspergillus niger TaxID=5061 RepID=A2QFV8_ASPNC|nr:hypothetical protein An03g00950 [Aspergillus niger]CAK38068.1 hypothetical protein An03g00950 [Aspergillus niger]